MPSLSFDEGEHGRAVALVKGGEDDGSVLYLHSEDSRGRKPKPWINRLKYKGALRHLTSGQKTRAFVALEEALQAGRPSSVFHADPELEAIYERCVRDSTSMKEIELDDEGRFELLPSPDPKKREVWYIAGQSGSGKSFIAKGIADMYHKLFPDRGVYLISKLKEDATLDQCKFIKRIKIDSLIDDYPELEEFRDTCLIFDDYDTLTGPAQKTVEKLIDDLAIMGRHTNTSMLCLSHFLTNYKKTRLILSEATQMVVYPQSTSYHALKHLLHNYAGVDEDDLKRHIKLGSRWLCYFKGYPSLMVSQRDAELLHQRK